MKEKYRWIKGWEGLYQVSNKGNVQSLRYGVKNLKPGCTDGYNRILLHLEGKITSCLVHRLVAKAFIKNEHNKPCINHKNGIRSDNRVENLEWCTRHENILHAWETGLAKNEDYQGESNSNSKLSVDEVIFIRTFKALFSRAKLCEIFNVSSSTIHDIIRFRTWTHI